MNKISSFLFCAVFTLCATVASAQSSPAPINLGTAANFAVLSSATVTSTGNTVIVGDIGIYPGTSCTGILPCDAGPGQVSGSIEINNSIAKKAEADLLIAYNDAKGLPAGRGTFLFKVPTDLGGKTLVAGLYTATSTLQIAAGETLTLAGNKNSVFIFQVGSGLSLAANAKMVLVGGVKLANIFWQVTSAATMSTNNVFFGTIMSYSGVTMAAGSTLDGRALALDAGITFIDNTVTDPGPAISGGGGGNGGHGSHGG